MAVCAAMKKLTLGSLVLFGLLAIACKKDEPAAAGGATGVADCDEYIKRYPVCISKMPAAAQPTAEAGFKAQVDAWKSMASTPDGKATLKTMCKPTLESLNNNPLCK